MVYQPRLSKNDQDDKSAKIKQDFAGWYLF